MTVRKKKRLTLVQSKLAWFFIGCMLFVCLTAISKLPASSRSAIPPYPRLKKGDWVFRQGTSLDSTLIHLLSHSDFSHIGIVVETDPEVRILHATTDDEPDHPNQVIVSPLAQFFHRDLAQKIAIVRPHFLSTLQKQKIITLLQKEIGAPFVLDEKKRSHRYCTTIIENAVQRIYPNFTPRWQTIQAPFFQGSYLFPDAFFNYPDTETIYISAIPPSL